MSVHHHRPAGSAIIIISLDGHFLVNKFSNCWWILFFSCAVGFAFFGYFYLYFLCLSGLVLPLWVDRWWLPNLLHATGSQSVAQHPITGPDGDEGVDDDAANRACNKLNAFHIAKSLVMNGQKLGTMADGVPFKGVMWIKKGPEKRQVLLDGGEYLFSRYLAWASSTGSISKMTWNDKEGTCGQSGCGSFG